MRRTMLKSKVHRATVTGSDLNYVGSITMDSDLLEAADIREHELVHVLDIDNGNRFETYTIAGAPGSGQVCVNGAAARLVHSGDKVIVVSYAEYEEAELDTYEPVVVHVDGSNAIVDVDAAVGELLFMSHAPERKGRPMTLTRLAEKKALGEPLAMVTAYDYPSAQVAEEAGVDLVLVGDSGAMTVLGYPTTVPVTTEELLMLAAAVRRGLQTPFLVGDLPFGSYEVSDEQAIATAQRFIKEAGCDAVKLERGGTSVQRAKAIADAGIPVMGHVGLTPQTATALGGYRSQGRTAERALDVVRDAVALQDAGCFSIVFEAVPSALTELLMPRMDVPVIGIGAGAATDGQVLVFHDLLGIYDGHAARFVKRYADVRQQMIEGVSAFAEEVRSRRYPEPEHGYTMAPDEIDRLQAMLEPSGEPFTGGPSL